MIIFPGSYALPHDCSLKTPHFNLRAIHYFTTDLDLTAQFKIPDLIPPANFSLSPTHPNITIKKLPQLTKLPTPHNLTPTFSYGYPVLITFIGIGMALIGIILILAYLRKSPVLYTPTINTGVNLDKMNRGHRDGTTLYPNLDAD